MSNPLNIGDECLPGYWGLERSPDDLNEDELNKLTTINRQTANQVNELELLFDNYVMESSTKFGLDGGCLPCDCNTFGSIDSHCNQTTGVCRCKYGVAGDKCDYCERSTHELTELGCVSGRRSRERVDFELCSSITTHLQVVSFKLLTNLI